MAKDNEFKIGDIVKLRSGGPDMTVRNCPTPSVRGYYTCQWFAGKKLESGDFNEASLERKTSGDS
ncbi:YodC family protein [Pseudomonas putida]